jgi:hypothetical protein
MMRHQTHSLRVALRTPGRSRFAHVGGTLHVFSPALLREPTVADAADVEVRCARRCAAQYLQSQCEGPDSRNNTEGDQGSRVEPHREPG